MEMLEKKMERLDIITVAFGVRKKDTDFGDQKGVVMYFRDGCNRSALVEMMAAMNRQKTGVGVVQACELMRTLLRDQKGEEWQQMSRADILETMGVDGEGHPRVSFPQNAMMKIYL